MLAVSQTSLTAWVYVQAYSSYKFILLVKSAYKLARNFNPHSCSGNNP